MNALADISLFESFSNSMWGSVHNAVSDTPRTGFADIVFFDNLMVYNAASLPVTLEGYQRLKDELSLLENEEMSKVRNQIATAREEGDLSENAEYHAAREKQSLIQTKIYELKDRYSFGDVGRGKREGRAEFFRLIVQTLKFLGGRPGHFRRSGADHIVEIRINVHGFLGRDGKFPPSGCQEFSGLRAAVGDALPMLRAAAGGLFDDGVISVHRRGRVRREGFEGLRDLFQTRGRLVVDRDRDPGFSRFADA